MTAPTPRECAAYPRPLRVLAVVLVAALDFYAVRALPEMRTAQWSFTGGATLVLAAVLIAWVAWWIVFSRTRLEGDEMVQTWLWDKRVKAPDVASFKLVYLRSLQAVVSPRLLVRRRQGGVTWFHAADAELLMAFANRVVEHQSAALRPPSPPPGA